ncbi:type VI secretion system membrane subunit TssM [Ideonella azotifigens]|uniref:Type VI secretion system membrane subunit TssM n=1 Tax=Ideonella azotifigens TaxID=513160 RepID=A0ABN1K0H4_9BURK|nr:type VI secretion system membrane subunit TssM [Ideonella azotifigens]MCD2341540.1 type VI secretion system membrane subunit TssM [Ideonella azotifigens]
MTRFLQLLLDPRVLGVLGLAALAAFLFLGADALQLGFMVALAVLGAILLVALIVWGVKRWRVRLAAKRLEQDLEGTLVEPARHKAGAKAGAETAVIRDRLHEAIKTIKTSKLGERTGQAALYELPWYMVIGNPAAGKSTAIVQSGLHFPFSGGAENIIQGIGGTRNCDWFFTSEGILLDTAGRYAVHEEDRPEWLSFLAMLKRNRPKAPINGILIAASLAELTEAKPDAVIRLAKNLRQRVQELTESLEVFAPVYVLFTKADLITGFVEFFEDQDPKERERAWGATLAYQPETPKDAVELFDGHFDELQDGLKEMALARMSLNRGKALPPAVLAFPLEFSATQPVLRSFIATLFEENPYQYRPVFRGFYFTSAVQQGAVGQRARNGVAEQFALLPPAQRGGALVTSENGFFLKDLFAKVLFADRNLVRQYASRGKTRLRVVSFAAGVVLLAAVLAGWSWSYLGNRQLVASVQADLDKAVKLQVGQIDLASRIQALELIQTRAEELAAWRDHHPMSVGLGLYQGEQLERKLRSEYFNGVRKLMLEPVAQALEGYLREVNQHAGQLKPLGRPATSSTSVSAAAVAASAATAEAIPAVSAPVVPAAPGAVPSRYVQASATDVEDAYKALKTYLMLAERQRMEVGHMTDQITRFWRGWLEDNRGNLPREQLMRSAERMITFSMSNIADPAFPTLNNNFGLVDQTRDNLRKVVQGTPALERVYADIKARASTRYPSMTVARIVGEAGKESVVGSYVVSGTFTREAWQGYVNDAFKDAANNELQSADWVLKTSTHDDLSLQGSPEQIRKSLTDLYKTEYVTEWQRFMQGVSVAEFTGFDNAVAQMNRLGDSAESPLRKLMNTLFEQTSWDNPAVLNEQLAKTQQGVVEWIKRSVLRMAPARVEVGVNVSGADRGVAMGPVGQEFAALARIASARDGGASLLDGYLQSLSKLRTRFNQMKNQGDPGPAARQLMAATLEGSGSELAEALRFVEEQMLTGASDSAKATLKPMLVRPLMQAFGVLVPPAETELNRLWTAQVLQPFQQSLAGKYPFDSSSRIEASATEVARVFGPSGGVAKFASEALGPLVTRRGDAISPRLWANQGLHLRTEFVNGFPTWVATLDGAAGNAGGAAAAGSAQSAFQLLPLGAPGFLEYTVEIDGQALRYRNGAAQWTNFVWPNANGAPGVRITGLTPDNRTVEVFSAPGAFGFERLIEAAQVSKLPDGVRELRWGEGKQSIAVQYRAITMPGAAAPTAAGNGGGAKSLRGLVLPELVAGSAATDVASAASAGGAQ